MNRKILLLSIIIAFSSVCNLTAQMLNFVTGEHQYPKTAEQHEAMKSLINPFIFSEFSGYNAFSFFIVDKFQNGRVISIYDITSLKKTGELKLVLSQNKDAIINVGKIIYGETSLTIYYSSYEKKGEDFTFNISTFDYKGKQLNHKTLVQLNIKSEKNNNFIHLEPSISEDNSKILIYKTIDQNFETKDPKRIDLWVFDASLKGIGKTNITLPYEAKNLRIEKTLISNNGKIVFVTSIQESRDKGVIKVFGLDEKMEQLEEIGIKDDGSFSCNCAYRLNIELVNKTDKLIINGLYHANNSNEYCNVKYISINLKTWEKVFQIDNTIKDEDLKSILTNYEGTRIGKDYGVENILLKNSFLTTQGTLYLIYEICYSTSMQSQSSSVVVHRNQIIQLELDSTGKLVKTTIIPKFQKEASIAVGFIPFYKADEIFFVYNDNKKNLEVNESDPFKFEYKESMTKPYMFKNATLVITKSSKKSDKLIKKQVFNNQVENVVIFPENYFRIDNTTIITWSKEINKGLSAFTKITMTGE